MRGRNSPSYNSPIKLKNSTRKGAVFICILFCKVVDGKYCDSEDDEYSAGYAIECFRLGFVCKKRGNLRPVLTYTVTLEDFERQLATPPLSITSLIPEPPESWQEHCWPGQHERAGQDDAGERPCYQLSIPSHKGRHGSQSLRLPWREDNSYPEVEASFRLLREAFASELERAGASRPMHEENSLELGGTALRSVAPAILGQRFLEAVGKA